MSSSPSFDSITISTFSPPRTAPRPRVIPLYATTIPHHGHCGLSMHQNLRPKALYQPYTQEKHNKPAPVDVSLSSSCNPAPSTPGSPLTPVDDELPDGRSGRIRTILIPPPNTKVTVANLGWPEEILPNYRKIARAAVELYLDISHPLSEQATTALEKARADIEDAIPLFMNHQRHWGADTLLRDQLKSVKDTRNKELLS
ncbi:hypothetical protein BT96DRAFT_951185 [Gymnopus androsaceus JB14]|uniref:Uncharacterized protein n=1 Tax=Gymnopus androsaceus JB14 TaxID=1447944 RepID=A0A6A4GDI4_9AGAR|nr:hypothetical protein BT96DRAFT_951185 [Gymnopus androsaceus JB14]